MGDRFSAPGIRARRKRCPWQSGISKAVSDVSRELWKLLSMGLFVWLIIGCYVLAVAGDDARVFE